MNDIIFVTPTIGRLTLYDSIESLYNLNGNYKWKVIIIFDGIKNNFEFKNYENIIILEIDKIGRLDKKNNAGLVRNKGIEYLFKNKILSKYIGFLDDDDTLNPNYIKNLYNEEKNFEFDCIIFRMMYQNYKIVPHPLTTSIKKCNVGISIVLKTNVLIENNDLIFNNHPYEDYLFIIKIKYLKKKILISKYVNYFVKTNYINCSKYIKNYPNIIIV